MITTIQIRENVKKELDRFKEGNKTYEEVILMLMNLVEQQKRKQKELLIEGCKEMAEDSLRITREWENTDRTLDWEW
jgi:predicted CopG family antitoxin